MFTGDELIIMKLDDAEKILKCVDIGIKSVIKDNDMFKYLKDNNHLKVVDEFRSKIKKLSCC